ncbi:TylF/MycF/NovP-related O-methyltransferase [Panacibacter microcysteis]
MKQFIRKILQTFNYDIIKKNQLVKLPDDFEDLHKSIYSHVKSNTMTSPERIYSLIEAVKYVENNGIAGEIVECGVWKGGSMMAVAQTLLHLKKSYRQLYLYDTYEGMSEPTEYDKTFYGEKAATLLQKDSNKEKNLVWAYSALDTVKSGMKSTGYPSENIHYIKGKVEDSIPATIPQKISILRLDTDWYESTKHELEHLFPLLTVGGVLILDDYGHWAGARKAVDEYFALQKTRILLTRIDETGRIGVKLQ